MSEEVNEKQAGPSSDSFPLPEGRIINVSAFVKDAYNKQATPAYKVEVAIPVDHPGLIELENKLMDAADENWGKGAGDAKSLVFPLLEGDKLMRRREKRGKDGSAYKGMTVIRASTLFNLEGHDAAGGINVYDEDVNVIAPTEQKKLYAGCKAIVGVAIGFYTKDIEDDDGDPVTVNGLKFYLSAIQKTGDGERIATGSNKSSLFKPVARPDGDAGGGETRRTRRQARG